MGAELIITIHPAPTTESGTPLRTVTDAVRAEVDRRIRAIDTDPEVVASVIADNLYVDDANTADETIAEMEAAVSAYLAEWEQSRDSTWAVINDITYVVTGGTTWGDDPSAHWSAACFATVHNLFDEPFPT